MLAKLFLLLTCSIVAAQAADILETQQPSKGLTRSQSAPCLRSLKENTSNTKSEPAPAAQAPSSVPGTCTRSSEWIPLRPRLVYANDGKGGVTLVNLKPLYPSELDSDSEED